MSKIYTFIVAIAFMTIFIGSSENVKSQVPEYEYTVASATLNTIPLRSGPSNRRQWIYHPADFANAPSGFIGTIYLKVEPPASPADFTNFLVLMGPTNLTTFSPGPFVSGLDTVFFATSFAPNILPGDWMEIPLQVPFFYDNTSNFIVDVSQEGYNIGLRIDQADVNVTDRSLFGNKTATSVNTQARLAQFGFDLISTGAPNDAGVIAVNAPLVYCPGTHDVVVTVQNYGTNQIDSVILNWSINGVTQTPVNYIGLLDTAGGSNPTTAQVNLGSYSFTNAAYNLVAWSSMPNGIADTTTFNDTITAVLQSNLPPPTDLTITNITTTSANFSWSGGSSPNTWIYSVVLKGAAPSSGVAVSSNNVTVTGLTELTGYDFYVREVCPTGDTSVWAGPLTFVTAQCPAGAYCFTNAGQSGRLGPSQAQVDAEYSGTLLDNNVTVTGNGIQLWVVPLTGVYRVTAMGAGYDLFPDQRGALISGDLLLNANDTLKILVGQTATAQGAGSGGSFVTLLDNTPLLIAGGAGGGNANDPDMAGSDGPDGLNANGGTGGSGGTFSNGAGGGGGGLLTDGQGTTGGPGIAFVNGGQGGSGAQGDGGFGGGAGNGTACRSSGGGGYSGGGGSTACSNTSWGGGGGSYNAGTNQFNQKGVMAGHGLVIIQPEFDTADIEMMSILLPSSQICGADNNPLVVVLKNNDTATAIGVPITAEITGAVATSFTFNLPSLAGGQTDTVTIGTISSITTGQVNITVYSNYAGDTVSSNDTVYAVVNISSPQADAGMNMDVCRNTPVTIGGSPTADNGTVPYSYSWSPAAGLSSTTVANPTATVSGDITYSVTVTDGFGCTATDDITLITLEVITPPTVCVGAPNISLQANMPGGTWSGTGITDPATGDFSPQVAGPGQHMIIYSVNISACQDADTVYAVVQPIPDATITAPSAYCYNESDDVLVAATSGGSWSGTGIISTTDGIFSPAVAGVGSHEIIYTITDSQGCTGSDTVHIEVVNPADPVLPPVPAHCLDGGILTLVAGITGGQWTGTGIADPQAGTFDPSIGLGTYKIHYEVMDSIGCLSRDSMNIEVVPVVNSNVDIIDESCYESADGQIFLSVTSGTSPFTYNWSNGDSTDVITGLAPGNYSVEITDFHGCTFTDSYEVEAATQIEASGVIINATSGQADGGVELSVSGGVSPYSYAWSNNTSGANLIGVPSGTYHVEITDANGCTETFSFDIYTVGISNTELEALINIYPNPAGNYFHVELKMEGNQKVMMEIMDVTGRKVYASGTEMSNEFQYKVSSEGWASGQYLIRLHLDGEVVMKRVNIVK